jgi:glycopeptide antibiotics resistance protein
MSGMTALAETSVGDAWFNVAAGVFLAIIAFTFIRGFFRSGRKK